MRVCAVLNLVEYSCRVFGIPNVAESLCISRGKEMCIHPCETSPRYVPRYLGIRIWSVNKEPNKQPRSPKTPMRSIAETWTSTQHTGLHLHDCDTLLPVAHRQSRRRAPHYAGRGCDLLFAWGFTFNHVCIRYMGVCMKGVKIQSQPKERSHDCTRTPAGRARRRVSAVRPPRYPLSRQALLPGPQTHRFWLLSTLCANTKGLYETELL
jgi:hypothetical protein